VALVLFALSPWNAVACREPSSPSHAGHPYLGRWRAQLDGAPCPFDVELLGDGTARTNFLNDDSPEQTCQHHELQYSVGSPNPDTITFAIGREPVRLCWFVVGLAFLDLACDEHGFPSRDTAPIRFSRVPEQPTVRPGTSIVGDWMDGGTRFSFAPDGKAVVSGREIAYRILNASELELLWPTPERCGYQFRGENELLLLCASMSLELRR
jgi:hypothetical protein